ncbi:hypothetical protein DY000_02020570 [Brassica cretica]|uniref:Uncharacterized protein n=1 Tax=Brassica cretica TaxID=69181 RepID=A0ABQ7ELN2_BRACR|nr:hypothetical protein DY000_02020570 [Brassica cretica]
MVDLLICCSEHDVSRCFSAHGGTLLMSWRSWYEPLVDEDGLLGAKPCLAAVELMSSGYGRLPSFSLDTINHSAWKPDAEGRTQTWGRDPDLGAGPRLEPRGGVGIHRFYDRFRDRGWNPEVFEIVIGPHKSTRFSFRSGYRIRTLVYLDPDVAREPRGSLGMPLRPCWNLEVWIRRSLFGTWRILEVVMTPINPRLHRGEPGGSSLDFIHRTRNRLGNLGFPFLDWGLAYGPEVPWEPEIFGFSQGPYSAFLGKTTTGTCLDFVFCRSEWPLSSSYVVFYICRKSLTCLEGAGVGVMTQVPGLRSFPRLEKQYLDCSLYFTVLL